MKRARQAKGWTASELARRVKVSVPYISQLEHAQREPSILTVVKLAKALGVPVTELLG